MSGSRSGGTDWALTPPSFSEIEEAAERIKGQAVITPLEENHELNAEVGSRIFVKAEMLQWTGSFSAHVLFMRESTADQGVNFPPEPWVSTHARASAPRPPGPGSFVSRHCPGA